ncbi:hypothetical protein CKO15_06080 [Halorhodospira abdelmalekii]|uniref:hypothetical protein n=1 Tax=Halorhodospira abdelmalekii TaxID=421629 RepID=UPI0019077F5B|nr:hypothetical protein [Halorhodospira abdelmalekii]MBK1734864.1 hypothetical protein [Halorhodospira abdelmalekii]
MPRKTNKSTSSKSTVRQPIADKIIKKMRRQIGAKVVDLSAVIEGKKNAEALQETVASREELVDLDPTHALYVYAQNQTSVMVEQLTMLPEMNRLARLIGMAEEQYMPGGPPMSPLTTSFFTSWAFFDAGVGLARETPGTTTIAIGKTFGMHKELLHVISTMQDSRMGVYAHEGFSNGAIVLRELITDRTYRVTCPSGYDGRQGELWYVRILPSLFAGEAEHIVLTTPYVLIEPAEHEWQAYFDRTLPQETPEKRIAAYEHHMKWGPSHDYWNEFVFEAYANHRHEAIFLRGLPDRPESRPHS